MKKTFKYVITAAVTLSMVACGGADKPSETKEGEVAELTGSVSIDGSSTVFPISEAVNEEYSEVQPKVKVVVNYSGTGGGFKKFVAGETDINDASRSIKDKEIKSCEENGVTYQELTVAYDGIAIVINKENDWAKEITIEELKKMWEPAAEGTVMKWSDIREGWPTEDLKLYGPGTASGTFDYFTEAIVGESKACRSDYSPNEDDNVLVNGVSSDKYALGYFGLAYYEENKNKINVIGVNNGTATVTPSLETVKSGEYAPLSRPLFIYVSGKSIKKPEVVDFVNYYIDNAPTLSLEAGYIPLKDSEYAAEKKKFADFCTKK